MITAVKYHEGMSKALDSILSKGDSRKAWIVRDDEYAAEVIIADSEEDAIAKYGNVLQWRAMPHIPRKPRRKRKED